MTLTATLDPGPDAGPDGQPDGAVLAGPPPAGPRTLEVLVGRLHAEFGVDPGEIRRLAAEVLDTFATARVQAFVPILVEKRLRATYRVLHRPPR